MSAWLSSLIAARITRRQAIKHSFVAYIDVIRIAPGISPFKELFSSASNSIIKDFPCYQNGMRDTWASDRAMDRKEFFSLEDIEENTVISQSKSKLL